MGKMKVLAATIVLFLVASTQLLAADIGTPGDFNGYPVVFNFLSPITTGVVARAQGDIQWKPVSFSGNSASFTVQGNAGLNMQVWNQDRPYYFQASNLWFMSSDYTTRTTTFTELSTAFPGNDSFDAVVTGTPMNAILQGKVFHREFLNIAASPSAVVPEPATGLLALLAIPALHLLSRSSKAGG